MPLVYPFPCIVTIQQALPVIAALRVFQSRVWAWSGENIWARRHPRSHILGQIRLKNVQLRLRLQSCM